MSWTTKYHPYSFLVLLCTIWYGNCAFSDAFRFTVEGGRFSSRGAGYTIRNSNDVATKNMILSQQQQQRNIDQDWQRNNALQHYFEVDEDDDAEENRDNEQMLGVKKKHKSNQHPLGLGLTKRNGKSFFKSRRAVFNGGLSIIFLGSELIFGGETTKAANAFEGGIGGLGKTKPDTGVRFFGDESVPLQNPAGIVTAEIDVAGDAAQAGNNNKRSPVLITFATPWPLLSSTSGLECRDLQQGESAFVQVVKPPIADPSLIATLAENSSPSLSAVKNLLISSVFSQQGKFGAYGAPTDIKVKRVTGGTTTTNVFSVTFTTLTPGLHESDRQVLIRLEPAGTQAIIMLIAGTTRQRFAAKETVLTNIMDSFQVQVAPETRLR